MAASTTEWPYRNCDAAVVYVMETGESILAALAVSICGLGCTVDGEAGRDVGLLWGSQASSRTASCESLSREVNGSSGLRGLLDSISASRLPRSHSLFLCRYGRLLESSSSLRLLRASFRGILTS